MAKKLNRGHGLRLLTCGYKFRGAAVVEMAVVTPLLLTLLFGVIEFGWAFMVKETLTNATREACRVGILQGSTTDDMWDRFEEAVAPTGIAVTADVLTIEEATLGDPIVTVKVSIPYEDVSLLGSYLGINPGTIGASCSMRKEGM